MLFTILCTDHAGHRDTRAATRDAHLAYLEAESACLVHAGPLLDAEGAPCGSLLVVEVADRAAAASLAARDPYSLAGLFASVSINGHRVVFRDGARVG